MVKILFVAKVLFLTFLWNSVAFASETGEETTAVSGNNQIVASHLNLLLDQSETGYVNVLVLDKEGNSVAGQEVQILPEDSMILSTSCGSAITNESGYINFNILGKQHGNTMVTVTDGVVSVSINVAIRNLIRYVLPYFYGDMHLSIINPSEEDNYVKVQFHENEERELPPVIVILAGKEKRKIALSEEMETTLKDGWVEIASTDIIFGGAWTSKGYLNLLPVELN
ncbi:MAG: hypothetical protein D8M57_07140 [Candidatus Scalindua sp. AMX11]|nr:MAG: hypothetical protein DWQ00_14710 [Candidatus Scalindua sp.]NOG85690.1 hypothetical protein [Planctomycetota bacterium]RZV82417.1 MAG: hypothetical protein EX341_09610 [Candidatus Scalindua sp. SCAELEC01]TDE65661.1 MAG: hypothetical protein D8M57_07140 [Candidatus Scalindua sp. AMX11]GJQ59143.1 MAG: hypothetical protein SCALA701_19440 [Candidatus Scalindua sp.]